MAIVMDRLSDVRIGDITKGLARYRPVVVTVIAILLMVAFLPGERAGRGGLVATAPPPALPVADAATAGTSAPVAVPTEAPVAVPSSSFDSGPPSFAVQPSGTFATGRTFESSSGSFTAPPPAFAGDEAAAAPDAEIAATPGGFEADKPKPLTITARLYATLGAGTPVATQDVPDKSSPVGNRLNQEDKRSYVRLAGSAKELMLTEAPQGRETRGPALVRACQVLDADWPEGKGVALASAPKIDAGACVLGLRASDGVWTFDLSAFASPTDTRGIALTVAPGSGVDFQVNFAEIVRTG